MSLPPPRPQHLASYAARAESSEGRRFSEPEHAYRNCFERDRDRIIHSRTFRRLEYKTQVFPNYEGDHFRTRLTHTIEVAQIARTTAKALGLNATLAEAVALAHDLGHPPFGHAGEQALDEALADYGGFEHNRHALRIIEDLEERYASFRGLNLTYEVREGIVKHTTRYDRFRHEELDQYRPEEQPHLEAQIIDWVDEIAYSVHDIDDGVEARILEVEQLAAELPLFAELYAEQARRFPDADQRGRFNQSISRLLDSLVTDLIETSHRNIVTSGIESLEDVRRQPDRLVGHSEEVTTAIQQVADFLMENLYRSPRVSSAMDEAQGVVAGLLLAYQKDPHRLPARHQRRFASVGEVIAIADYVAGMTDRFALSEFRRFNAT